jgi:tRNA threonylcarbamoyl adenosine modification protein YeaZ
MGGSARVTDASPREAIEASRQEPEAGRRPWTLVIDTATRQATVALGHGSTLIAEALRDARHRHAAHVLDQIDEVLSKAGIGLGGVAAIGVGTGPGSFTGLRVALATAKSLAWSLQVPIVGVDTTDALRHAVRRTLATAAAAGPDATVVLPAGARDHYVASSGGAPELVAPGALADAVKDGPVIAVDVDPEQLRSTRGWDGRDPEALGAAALEGLGAALLELVDARLCANLPDDPVTLVPAYVALPRGVSAAAAGMAWSPDLR